MAGDNKPAEEKEEANVQNEKAINRSQFIKKFFEFQVNGGDGKEGVTFLNGVIQSGKITSETKKALEFYKKYNSNFKDIDLDNITNQEFLEEASKHITIFSNKREKVKAEIAADYDISNKTISQKIDKEIDEKELKDLDGLLNSQSERNKVLKNIFKADEFPVKMSRLNFLEGIDINDRAKNLSKSDKSEIYIIMESYKNGNLTAESIDNLLSLNLFSLDEKKRILTTFVPTISLQQGIDWGIINNAKAKQVKTDLLELNLKKLYQDGGEDVHAMVIKKQAKKMSENLSNREIDIPTSEYIDNEKELEKLLENKGGQLIAKSFREMKENKEQYLKENAPENYEDFLKELSSLTSEGTAKKFDVGSVFVLTIKNKQTGSTNKHFLEITDKGNTTGIVETMPRGENTYNNTVSEKLPRSYNEILSFLKGDSNDATEMVNIDILNKKELNAKITSGEIEAHDDLGLVSEDEIEGNLVGKEEDLTRMKNEASKKIRKSEEYEKIRKSKGDAEAESWLRKKVEEDSKIKSHQTGIDELTHMNLKRLKNAIDKLDSEGTQHGLETGVTFKIPKKDDYYTIVGINDRKGAITLQLGNGTVQPDISFADFYAGWKDKGPKRVAKSSNWDQSMESLAANQKGWKNYTIKNGKIKRKFGHEEKGTKKEEKEDYKTVKIKEETGEVEYNYLVVQGGVHDKRKLVQIVKNNGDNLTVKFGHGSFDDKKVKDEVEKDKDKEKFEVGDKTYTVSASFLESYIKEHKLAPRALDESKDIKKANEEIEVPAMHGSFMSRLFHNMSVAELIQGGTLFIESFEKFLKEGNDEHAAKVASFLGKFAGAEVQADLKTRLEAEQKKRQDDYVEQLKGVDSSDATKMIERWLLNKDSPEEKKIAGMIFMYEKYGTLYAKKGLNKYSGSFFWYEALGGKVGDELYNKEKKAAEEDDVNFSEEWLVYKLMAGQCSPDFKKYGAKERRRSRIHKEVKKLKETGKEGERETGIRDAKGERTIEGRVKFALGELSGGTFPNGCGAMEEIVNKGGPLHLMNKVPFILFYAGIADKIDQQLQDQIKNIPNSGKSLIMLRNISQASDIKFMNKTILQMSKKISDETGDADLYKQSKHLFSLINSSGSNYSKVKDVVKFYDTKLHGSGPTYGELLTNALYGVDNGDTSEYSYLNHTIYLDDDFKEYTEKQNAFIKADIEFNKDEELIQDSFNHKTGIQGLGGYKFAKQNFGMDSGGVFRRGKAGPVAWQWRVDEFEAMTERSYKNEEDRFKMVRFRLRNLLAGLRDSGGRDAALEQFNNQSYVTGNFLNKNGINMKNISDVGLNSKQILNGDADEAFINQLTANILNPNIDLTESTRFVRPDRVKNTVSSTGETVQTLVDDYDSHDHFD